MIKVPGVFKARIAFAVVAGAIALAHACGVGAHTGEKHFTFPVIGTPAYDASCVITHEWEDQGARAVCSEDGETYLFDADGGFIYDHGIKFFYRPEGTWYVAPEFWQEGPGA